MESRFERQLKKGALEKMCIRDRQGLKDDMAKYRVNYDVWFSETTLQMCIRDSSSAFHAGRQHKPVSRSKFSHLANHFTSFQLCVST